MAVGKTSAASYVITGVLVAVALFAVVLGIAHTGTRDWTPIGDEAILYLRALDVGSEHSPLVGPYSRFGWSHPGPAIYFVFAAAIRSLGRSFNGLLVGSLANSLVCSAGLVALVARRLGGAAAVVVGLLTAVLCLGLGDWLIDPWNPFFAVLPFATFLIAAWLASSGDAVSGAVACVAGSVSAESHLGALPPVVMIGGTAMCLAVAAAPRGVRLRSAAWNVALLAILWAPPAIQEFTAARGNLSTIARFLALTRPEAAMGWWRGVQTASGLLLPWGPWVGNEHPGMIGDVLPGAAWQVALVGALLFFTAVMAVRIRDGVAVRLVVILFVATLACVAAVVKVRGPPFYYLLLWTRPVAMMLVAGPLLILVRHRGVTFSPRLAPYASLASIGLVLVVVSARAWRAEIPLPLWSRIHANLGKIALREISPRAKVRVVMIGPPYTASAEALCAVFQSAGRNARLTELASAAVGPHRIIGSRIRLPTLVLATGIGIERVPHVERARLLYFNDPLPQKDREEARSLRAKLADQFVALGRADLVPALEAAAPWLWMQSPPGVDAVALGRYTALASGTDKLPVALYSLPAVTW